MDTKGTDGHTYGLTDQDSRVIELHMLYGTKNLVSSTFHQHGKRREETTLSKITLVICLLVVWDVRQVRLAWLGQCGCNNMKVWPWCQHQPTSIMIRNSTGILVTCHALLGERPGIKIILKTPAASHQLVDISSQDWGYWWEGKEEEKLACVGDTLNHPGKVSVGCRWL